MERPTLDDLAAKCIRCGFCLESCPTYLLSGRETESPRGRIYLARTAEAGGIAWFEAAEPFETCVGCRACETACPSGVEYGAILELARERLAAERPNRTRETLIEVAASPRRMAFLARLGRLWRGRRIPWLIGRQWSRERAQAAAPIVAPSTWKPLDESDLPPVRGRVAFLEGCAMRVLFPGVNEATRRLLRRVGFEAVSLSADCCGALHAHGGLLARGTAMAETVFDAAAGLPIVVNSAGCGSHLKDLGGPVLDFTQFLVREGLGELLRASAGLPGVRATYHDACHLAHGQGIRSQPRELLASVPGLELVELPEADLCCGSGGIYNLTQPDRARAMLDRKWSNIVSTGATVCVLANPGCHAWIAQAAREAGGAVQVLHIAELLERCFAVR